MRNDPRQEIKDRLSEYKNIMAMLDNLSERIQRLDEKAQRIKSPTYSAMPRGGGSPITSSDIIADKADLERRRARFEEKARQSRDRVESIIDTVISPKHNDILYMHFIKLQSMEDIADQEGYSERHVWRLYREAVGLVNVDDPAGEGGI